MLSRLQEEAMRRIAREEIAADEMRRIEDLKRRYPLETYPFRPNSGETILLGLDLAKGEDRGA